LQNKTLIKVLIAMALAVLAGILTDPTFTLWDVSLVEIYDLIGKLFLNALTLVVVPLVAASIITGTARMGSDSSFASLGVKTFLCYVGTIAIAVMIGWFWIVSINPGASQDMSALQSLGSLDHLTLPQLKETTPFQNIEAIFLKLVPSNILAVASEGQMLGLIFFSLLFGFFIPQIETQPSQVLLGFWKGLFQVMMRMTHLVMRALPLGVFALVAKVVATTGFRSLSLIGGFFVTVLIAYAIYVFIALPLFLLLVARVNPIRHYAAVAPALLTAFSTSSSAATLPITIECMEKRVGISNRICSFVVPLATSLNMSGTGLYTCASVMFICQVNGVALTFPTQLFIALLALLTSIGMAGIPSASIAVIIMVLHTIGVPSDAIALIWIVERFLDMLRTVVNVLGNTCCATAVAKMEGEDHVLAA